MRAKRGSIELVFVVLLVVDVDVVAVSREAHPVILRGEELASTDRWGKCHDPDLDGFMVEEGERKP
jgi:hypothetical protein